MRVLDRYIIKTVCSAVALVMAVLLTLLALFLFINEQGFVGAGNYGNLQALRFVALNLPSVLFQFLPVAALIGTLLAIGAMAKNSELTVMRAAGVSVGRIALSVVMAGLLLVPVGMVTGEFLAPPLVQTARLHKAIDRNSSISLAGRDGAWVRDGNLILRANQQSAEGAFGGITAFELTESNRLRAVGRAARARETADGGWELTRFTQSRFDADAVSFNFSPSRKLDTRVGSAFFGIVARDPMELSVRELRAAIRYLDANGQETRRYRFSLWSIIARLVAIPLAMLLAVPFLFGSMRSVETGARVTLGMVLGLGYFILQRMVESGTIAFALDPLLLAWLPTLLLGTAVAVLFARVRA
jgi:lipopolysaccharide export system permease protein